MNQISQESDERGFLTFDMGFGERCADAFYEELFLVIPGAEDMFRNQEHQRQMFATMLNMIMDLHQQPDQVTTALRDLGRKHQELGVISIHLKAARQPFLIAIEKAEPSVTEEEKQFFDDAFETILGGMLGTDPSGMLA